jgi:adenylate kinase|eukprot:CAMPEP_0174285672 /NCGR_PEP_ID=MMETSP0809-20121228/9336_1 /TAXON_ID=73025 ORGANISM="Eutreptiella gymnastica-like, Strain CCMP1594" /NCGR_SAMPLE_ID=MMETSP0809 /ASSEMBLY_ACC=CAM_ASM_000658 /LENGTH=245 /DNA_ID=CAMNT_0015381501 /DNA_START=41 /DNA_END=778 /DNA_ORIENTATION=+
MAQRNLFLGLGGFAAAAGSYYAFGMQPAAKPQGPRMIICGAPGCGKGTQCELLKEKYGVHHISTGDVLRANVKEGTDLGKKAKGFMDRGELVPDDLIIGIMASEMKKPEVAEKGWLLDGVPRTKAQCVELDKACGKPDVVLWLDVPDKVLEERVCGRRLDPVTGDIYHVTFKPCKDAEVAKRLITRSDDTAAKLKTRLKMYHENTATVAAHYDGLVAKVDGLQKPPQVFDAICSALDKNKKAAAA